ncbi:Target of rapamycin complex 2 subunit bit61 [Bienertia sinuspersici]
MTSKSDSQNAADMTNPLYLHPSDGPHTGTIQQKLVGSSNYISWKRDMGIVLASKRKLGFVTRHVQRDASNKNKRCGIPLEKRFSMTNGTRKDKLNRDAYDLKQKGKSVKEYYIAMKAIWDELNALEDYPPITTMNAKIRALVDVMNRRKEEARLFQFLYGLDETYAADRSQLLHYSTLPSVEVAVSRIQ